MLPFHRLLTAGRPSRLWVLLGLALVALGFVLAQTLAAVVIIGGLVLGGDSLADATDYMSGTDRVTPGFLALVNLGWAAAIPLVLLAVWLVHGLRPGWASSVVGRLRWRWMLTCFALSFVALLATLVVSALLPAQGGDASLSGELNSWSSTTRDFLLVVVLLTPLQAAGEEYAFRGYLTQGIGSVLAPWPRVSATLAVLVPALVFALFHGLGQDVPLFLDRFAFGVLAGFLVLATGGLEAGIALHVLNNLLAFGLAIAFTDMDSALDPQDSSWWSIPVTLTRTGVYLVVVLAVARRTGIATRGGPAPVPAAPELVGPDRRV